MIRRALGAMLAAAVVVLSACSDEGNGNDPGVPPETQPPVTAPSSNPNGVPADAPKVANPVQNLDKFKAAPCDMLTKPQASEIGFDAKIAPDAESGLGPACEWQNTQDEEVSILLHGKQPLGISGIYRNKQQYPNFYKYFEPVDIGGFPGVFSDINDKRPNGICVLSVGVTDQQIITVTDFLDNDEPCDVVKRAAEAAVTTMSKG